MPAPQAILCHLCHGKYFKRSFPIHLKQCEAKWKKTHSRCEYCGNAVANHDWSDHRKHCKPTRSKTKRSNKSNKNEPLQVPQSIDSLTVPALNTKVSECEECETENASWQCVQCEQCLCAMCEVELHKKGARARHTRIPMNAKALQQENLSVITQNDCKDSELTVPQRSENNDGRRQCKFCSRKFNPDRVEKHMRICAKSQKKSKKRRVYDGAKKRVEGTVFEEFMYNRSQTPPQVKKWKKEGRRWREESNHLRQIADINVELQKTRENNMDKKDEENEIDIHVPSKKPMIKKSLSTSAVTSSSLRSISSKRKNIPLKGSSLKIKSRPLSNKSSNIGSSSSRKNKNDKEINSSSSKYINSNRYRNRSKKPAIPRFSRRNSKNDKDIKVSSVRPKREIKKSINKSKSNGFSVSTSSRKSKTMKEESKSSYSKKVVEKENSVKNQQPIMKKTRSAANSLPRGIELGVNVNKIFDDQPKTMNDYVERERLRRKQSRMNKNKNVNVNNHNNNKNKSVKAVPIKKMSKLQIKKEIRIENQPIGGKRKPTNSRDLSSKRAAYFENLLNEQE